MPSWAPPDYKQCDMAVGGGATEEDFYCTVDMGLSPADVQDIYSNFTQTMTAVFDAVNQGGGYVWQQLEQRESSLDLADPRPSCATYLRENCVADSPAVSQNVAFFAQARAVWSRGEGGPGGCASEWGGVGWGGGR